ncbi:lipopolysaccharide biosynthesis protein [bacterium]|nr:lipopolysaccharide biosynthesis protein [bacterium]
MSENIRNKAFSNILWRLAERTGAQAVAFLVEIVLARLLAPEAFGIIAIVTVFINVLQVFVDSGLGNALIQKKHADDLDFSSVFYFNMAVCIVLYGLMFAVAPLIADFYGMPDLTSVVRVLSLMLIISGVCNIQQAYVSRHLIFKRFFYSTLGGTVFAAVVGIAMAYNGFGVWAVVAQQLSRAASAALILWVTVKWRPKLLFSFERLKGLFSYGWKLLASALIEVGYRELRSLIIGKLYTTSDLAFYNRSTYFPRFIVSNINSSIDSVLLPTMSAEQDDRQRVRAMTRRAIKTSTYIIMPCMAGLAVCAEPLVRLLLTEKWLPCVPFLRIFCFTYAFYPIHTANLNAMKALGRSDLFLKLEIIKKILGLISVLATMWISVLAMAYSALAVSLCNQIVNSWPNRKLLDYKYGDQFKDMLPQIILSLGMGAVVYCISFIGLDDILTLLIQVSLGAFLYVAGSKLFKIDSFEYLLSIVQGFFMKRKKT